MRFISLLFLLLPVLALAQPQRPRPVAPLQPIVVQLLPGDVVGERLVGLDSITYQTARHAVEAIPLADATLASTEREIVVTRQQLSASLDANQLLVRDLRNREQDYQNLLSAARKVAGKPPARSWLLDTHTWLGALVGAVAGGLLVLTR